MDVYKYKEDSKIDVKSFEIQWKNISN
jgi:hypothetical protein